MTSSTRKAQRIAIAGLPFAALILGYFSFPDDIVVPNKVDHPYKFPLVNGCYQVFDSAYLNKPGCYVLQNDVFVETDNQYFAWISSDNVRLDLNGKNVTGPGALSMHSGIYIEAGNNIMISNGSIGSFRYGIRGEPSAAGEPLKYIHLKNLKVSNASLVGIKLVADEVHIESTKVQAPQDVDNRENDYVNDIKVEAETCYYDSGDRDSTSIQPMGNPLVSLPENCLIAKE